MKKVFRILLIVFLVLNISTKEVILKDKESKLTLIKCDIDDVENYYENYKESPLTYGDYKEIKGYIVENIIMSDENTDINNNYNRVTEGDDYNKSNLNDKEITNNIMDNNSYDSNNESFNTVSAIKSKNMNRVLSIIFLVLFSCVVVSLLIDSIFFRDKN